MAKHFSADQWRAWFLEFEGSGLTVANFCHSVGVSVQSYYKWRQRLKLVDGEQANNGAVSPDFVPVVIGSSTMEIEFPGGVVARLSNDVDSLRPLVKVLLELGAPQ